MSATTPPEPTPADAAVELLKHELPGFAAEFHAETDRIRVRGPIFFNAYVGVETLYAVPDREEAIRRVVEELVRKTREHAIKALGLETMIRLELQRARHEASVEAFAEGKKAGITEGKKAGIVEGRREMLAEVIAATNDGFYEGPTTDE